MYEELLPIWKARCKSLHNNSHATVDVRFEWCKQMEYIKRQGGTYTWFNGSSDEWMDCLVNGIMVFTWEQGISE